MSEPIVIGHGPHPVIVLHGWFGSAAAWQPLWPALDRERFSYAFMDGRGHGARRDEPGECSMEAVAADAVALADRLGWARFSVVGHSMGGKAGQRVLLAAPERVTALVGITPVPASGVPFDDTTAAFFARAADEPAVRAAIIGASTGQRLSPAWIDTLVAHSVAQVRPDAMAKYLASWSRGDFSAEVAGRRLPVQVLVGEHDAGLDAALMRDTWLRWYPDAELAVIGNAGHYPMDETPVALATAVEAFLARAVPAR